MIYLLALVVPPLALAFNGQPVSAVLNLILFVPSVFLGLIFPMLFLVPSLHAVIAIVLQRENSKQRQPADAIESQRPPPG
jgi:type II secretory pathway component PulF